MCMDDVTFKNLLAVPIEQSGKLAHCFRVDSIRIIIVAVKLATIEDKVVIARISVEFRSMLGYITIHAFFPHDYGGVSHCVVKQQ